MAVEKLEVALLNVRAVGEHDDAQICRRFRRVNRLGESVIHEKWQPSGMIQMSMRKHDCVDLVDRAWERSIFHFRIAAMPLKQSAVEQDGFAVDADDVTRTGHFPGSPDKLDFHVVYEEGLQAGGMMITAHDNVRELPDDTERPPHFRQANADVYLRRSRASSNRSTLRSMKDY